MKRDFNIRGVLLGAAMMAAAIITLLFLEDKRSHDFFVNGNSEYVAHAAWIIVPPQLVLLTGRLLCIFAVRPKTLDIAFIAVWTTLFFLGVAIYGRPLPEDADLGYGLYLLLSLALAFSYTASVILDLYKKRG